MFDDALDSARLLPIRPDMRLLKLLIACTALSVSVGPATAGRQFWAPLKIDKTNRTAEGSLSSVRADNARDGTTKYIECWLTRNQDYDRVECAAALDSRTVVNCDTVNRSFVPVVQTINSASHILFKWNSAGKCTYIYVDNGSYHLK